jgi:hypothetical protein
VGCMEGRRGAALVSSHGVSAGGGGGRRVQGHGKQQRHAGNTHSNCTRPKREPDKPAERTSTSTTHTHKRTHAKHARTQNTHAREARARISAPAATPRAAREGVRSPARQHHHQRGRHGPGTCTCVGRVAAARDKRQQRAQRGGSGALTTRPRARDVLRRVWSPPSSCTRFGMQCCRAWIVGSGLADSTRQGRVCSRVSWEV